MVIVHRYVRWSKGQIFPPAKIASHQAIQGLEDSAWTSLTINMSAMTSSGWTGLVFRPNRWPQRLTGCSTGCSTGNCGLRQDARNHWEQDRKANQKQVWSRHLARFHMISPETCWGFITWLVANRNFAGKKLLAVSSLKDLNEDEQLTTMRNCLDTLEVAESTGWTRGRVI